MNAEFAMNELKKLNKAVKAEIAGDLIRREYIDGTIAVVYYERTMEDPLQYRGYYIVYDATNDSIERYVVIRGRICESIMRCSNGVLPLIAVKEDTRNELLERLKNAKSYDDFKQLWGRVGDILSELENELDMLEDIEVEPPDVEMWDDDLLEEEYY